MISCDYWSQYSEINVWVKVHFGLCTDKVCDGTAWLAGDSKYSDSHMTVLDK